MPFGHDAGPTKVFSYLARAPKTGLETVREQMLLGHKYKNALVELELKRRARYAEITTTPEMVTLEAEATSILEAMAALRNEISARNREAKRKLGTAEERKMLAAWRVRLAEIRGQVKAMRRERREQVKAELETMELEIRNELKLRRAASGLYWGNYLQVEQSIEHSGPPPRFQRWTGEGKVALQIQGGMSMDEMYFSSGTLFDLDLPEPAASKRQQKLGRTMAYMRVASDDAGKPIWAEIPIQFDRRPPADARIKWVFLVRRRVHGTEERWFLQLVVERNAGWEEQDCATTGAVGVDVGWRRGDDCLRVAAWVGDDGVHGELILEDRLIVEKWKMAEIIQGERALEFNTARDGLADWLSLNAEIVPDWLRERSENLRQWRSKDRLGRLVRYWADHHQFDGGAKMLTLLEDWRSQDRRDLHFQASTREQAVLERLDRYRKFATLLRRRYGTICVEDWNIRETIARPKPEEADSDKGTRFYHRIAAPGLLRQLVTAKAREVQRVKAAMTTQTCAECHATDRFDAAEHLVRTCATCGFREDQDYRAARNLLRLGREQSGDGRIAPSARGPIESNGCRQDGATDDVPISASGDDRSEQAR